MKELSMKLGHEREYEHLGNGVEKAILNEERLNGEQRLGERQFKASISLKPHLLMIVIIIWHLIKGGC